MPVDTQNAVPVPAEGCGEEDIPRPARTIGLDEQDIKGHYLCLAEPVKELGIDLTGEGELAEGLQGGVIQGHNGNLARRRGGLALEGQIIGKVLGN